MKKIILTTLMGISLIGFSLTNKEIIEQGGVRQKQTFDKYFNGNSGNTRRDSNLLNRVYPEIILGLYKKSKYYPIWISSCLYRIYLYFYISDNRD